MRVAMRAGEGWRARERCFGRRLRGAEGLAITGNALAPTWERALGATGAPCQTLDPAAFVDRWPISQPPPAALLWDHAAGAPRARPDQRVAVPEYGRPHRSVKVKAG